VFYATRALVVVTSGLLLGIVGRISGAESARAGTDRSSFVSIGGIDQWVSIKGEDRGNLVLLVNHGGPGEAQWPQAAKYKPWERAFTAVQWDQRGAGHAYGRYGA